MGTERRRWWAWAIDALLAAVLACGALADAAASQPEAAAKPPYPPSPLIASIEFDFASRTRRAPGSDNWQITWADDDHQYAAWGDGGRFDGDDGRGRVSLGVARIEGGPADHRGINVWGGQDCLNKATFDGKSYGIIGVDKTLYMWVSPGSGTTSFREARLAKSADHGATWTKADWAFTKAEGVILPTICQFGRDYSGARDGYVYHYMVRLDRDQLDIQQAGKVDLARVAKEKMMERPAYEFFAGLNTAGREVRSKRLLGGGASCPEGHLRGETHEVEISRDKLSGLLIYPRHRVLIDWGRVKLPPRPKGKERP